MALDHTYLTRYTYSNFSWSHQQIHCPREEGLPTQSTARRLTDPWVRTQLLSQNSQWSSGEKSSLCWQLALGLLDPYHQHAISTFNTCLWRPAHRSLTDTGGDYSLGGAGFPQITPRPSQPTVSTFHLRAPPGLQFNQVLPTKPKLSLRNLRSPCGLPTTRPSTMTYVYD
jgi:hypothetical protein